MCLEVGRDAVMDASGRGDGASNGDALDMARNTQGGQIGGTADGKQEVKDLRAHVSDRGWRAGIYLEVEGKAKGELAGRNTKRTHLVL